MELIIYSRDNTSSSKVGRKTISVNIQGGVFSLSSTLVKEMELTGETRLLIAQQKSNTKNWFFTIEKNNNSSAFRLTQSKGALLFRCTTLARKILMSYKESKSVRFLVTGDTQEFAGTVFYQLVPIAKQASK